MNVRERGSGRAALLSAALTRVEAALLHSPVLEAVIARRESGTARPADPGHAQALAEELCRFQAADGSWAGSLAGTAEALLLLHTITPIPTESVRSAVTRALAWMRGREGVPGAFGEGCDPQRHEAGTCEHALVGMLSPGPPDEDLSGLALSAPARFGSDPDARLGVSCVALQGMLRWGAAGPSVEVQLGSIRQLVAGAFGESLQALFAGYVAAAGALVDAPRTDRNTDAIGIALARILGAQRGDGSWPAADVFHVLDVLLRATAAGHGGEATEGAILRAAELLALLQQRSGSWGQDSGPERMLVGWRVLRHAVRAAGSAQSSSASL